MSNSNRAVKLRAAAFNFVREGPPIDAKDTNGIAANRRLLTAAIDYAKEQGYARQKK